MKGAAVLMISGVLRGLGREGGDQPEPLPNHFGKNDAPRFINPDGHAAHHGRTHREWQAETLTTHNLFYRR
jgi:hypothetical protein